LPQKNFLKKIYNSINLDISFLEFKEKILITIRPPATMAAYHQFANILFDKLLIYLSKLPSTCIIYLPRNKKQKYEIESKVYLNFYIPNNILEGKNLVYYSDIIISAGGTMNREAAVLGTPTYTIFAGKMGSVDKNLIKKGLLTELKNEKDFKKINIIKNKKKNKLFNSNILEEIYSKILEILKK
jgi:uncharacterized protein